MLVIRASVLVSLIFTLFGASELHAGPFGTFVDDVGFYTNDVFGDGRDRYRTHSYSKSYFYEKGLLNRNFELRYRLEVITPDSEELNLKDRFYFGGFGVAIFNHGSYRQIDYKIGGELLIVGPQTQIARLQDSIHRFAPSSYRDGLYMPSESEQPSIGNRFMGMGMFELSRNFRLGEKFLLRPYAGGQFGYEDKLTFGADIVIGRLAQNRIWGRDTVTGSLMAPKRGIFDLHRPLDVTLIAGADIALIGSSELISANEFIEPSRLRKRARIGLQMSLSDHVNLFIGQSYLSREFVEQKSSQRIGVIAYDIRF